jgi:hypothetical protein
MNEMNHMSHERASFGAALRDAAESFTVPPTERIHERALRRGRQIRRRRTAGTLSAALAVAAVGVLTASLLSAGTPTRTPTETATSTQTAATMTRTQLGVYMAVHLRALLPPKAEPTSITIPIYSSDGYSVQTPDGDWAATAYVIVSVGGKRYVVAVDVTRTPLKQTCASHPPTDVCTSKSLGRGTLVTDVSMTTPGKMAVGWNYYWNLAGDASVRLSVNPYQSPDPHDPFTQQQAEALVTAPAWTSVLNGLPQIVHCDNLKMSEQGIASEWTCPSTGKVYPGPWMVALAE